MNWFQRPCLADGNFTDSLAYLDDVAPLWQVQVISLVVTVHTESLHADARHIVDVQHLSTSSCDMQCRLTHRYGHIVEILLLKNLDGTVGLHLRRQCQHHSCNEQKGKYLSFHITISFYPYKDKHFKDKTRILLLPFIVHLTSFIVEAAIRPIIINYFTLTVRPSVDK